MQHVKTAVMIQDGNPGLEAQLAAALDWWRDAGVDAVFHDEPASWIAPPEENRPAPLAEVKTARERVAAPVEAVPTIVPADLPRDLAEFTAWWLAAPALDGGRAAGRVPPRGSSGAKLMVLVPEPEAEDTEKLLSGPQGRLLDAMLAAMGIAPEEAYVASALPRHTPHPDWEAIAAQGMGTIVAHHVSLVRPRQLLSFGQTIPSLVNNAPTNSPAHLLTFNHDGVSLPWLSDRSLGAMLERPRWKAGFWQRWLGRAGVI